MRQREQVVKNLSTGVLSLLRSFCLGLTEMGFNGQRGLDVIREACLDACRRLEADPPWRDKCPREGRGTGTALRPHESSQIHSGSVRQCPSKGRATDGSMGR